jgi:outer membrane protein assembly factor BamB
MRVYGSAIVSNDVVYFGCFDGKLRGVDPLTGAPVTEFLTQGCKDNYQKVFNNDGSFRSDFELYGRDYNESERIIHTLGAILSTPVADAGVLYFGSSDGNLYAVEAR